MTDLKFRNNENLKAPNAIEFVDEKEYKFRTREIVKCARDPIYFAQKYFYIISPNKGKHVIKLYKKQKELIKTLCVQDRVCVLASRQVGKCLLHSNMIKVKNKKTGKIENMSIGEFHKKIKNKRFTNFRRKQNIIDKIKKVFQKWILFVKNVVLKPKEKNH